ncbi:hypothetical protein ABZ749_14105 [Micromonospora sp. NPDC047753]|uniref:hypothetical protein n=1 Tax=Micromonospora sp. NPDC047753 TaxID=3154817 RepID=UPI0033F851B8
MAGEVLHRTRAASAQFLRPIFVRVIRVRDWPTYDGWLWIDGYELAANGDAVAPVAVRDARGPDLAGPAPPRRPAGPSPARPSGAVR